MGANKVILNTETGEEVVIDISNDTVTPETLLKGYTAHGADGELIEGQYIAEAAGGSGAGLPDTIVAGDTPVFYNSNSYQATKTSLTSSGLSITVPKAGTYRFKWVVSGGNGKPSYTVQSRLYKNNTAVGTQRTSATTTAYSEDITCNAGDTVTLYLAGFVVWGDIHGGCGGFCACIDWYIDWNGSSGGGSGGNAFSV